MQLQQLDYVLAVVDEGSFTAAARSRGVSQPSLSQGVRALESELGAELFHRAGRRGRLTAGWGRGRAGGRGEGCRGRGRATVSASPPGGRCVTPPPPGRPWPR